MKDFIVGVDACLSSKKSYLRKYYLLDESPIKPGAGLNKELPEVGDMSMKFCISKSHDDVMDTLRNYSEEKLEKRIKKAAKFTTELDNELYEIYANNIKNRQEVN
jgi:putative sporulation protein YyaC